MSPDLAKVLDPIVWAGKKVRRGKATDLRDALVVLDDPSRSHEDKRLHLTRISERIVETGPVFTGAAAMAPAAVVVLRRLPLDLAAHLGETLVLALCNGDVPATALGIPSHPDHAKRYGKGAGKVMLDAIRSCDDVALRLVASDVERERRAGVLLLAYTADTPASRDALRTLANDDESTLLRASAAWVLATKHDLDDRVLADVSDALGLVGAPLVAAIRVARDGATAGDADIAACGITPALSNVISASDRMFPFGGVGNARTATEAALNAVGPRGEARVAAIRAENLAAYNKMMGR